MRAPIPNREKENRHKVTNFMVSLRARAAGPRWPVGGEEVKWGVPEATLVFLGAQSLSILWFGAMTAAIFDGDVPPLASRAPWTLVVLSFGLWAGYGFGPIFMNKVTGSGPMVDFKLALSPRQGVAAFAVGAGAQLAVLPALYWVVLKFVDGDPGQAAEELAAAVDTPIEIMFFFASAVVFAPIVEEWFYRGMLLPALARRFGTPAGLIGSTALFTLVHLRPISFPGLFVFGLMLGLLTIRTARLGPAIIAHMAFNAVTATALVFF